MLDLTFQLKTLGAFVALVLAGNVLRAKLRSRSRLPLPPGPPGHWLFGNHIPSANQSQQFAEWINTYGPIISLRLGPSRVMVIIGRHQESNDIMEKEGGVLADRPRAVAAGEILSRGLYMILAPAGEQFRRLRKAAHTHLQAKAADSYAPIQMDTARDVILDILHNPKGHQAAANRYAATVMLRIMYGKSTPTATNAPEIIVIHKVLKRFQMLMRPGALLIERFPILKYVPGYTTELEEWRREESQVYHDQLNRVSRELATGKAGPSFARHLLANQSSHQLSDDEMAYLAGSLFGAGADTTAVAIMYVVMASACYPKAQEKVQEQLDIVVGRDRAPTFDDYNSLPQIEAFMLECLRWRPVTTIGFAHRASADIVYKGMLIPEGAIVFGNHWAISRDPSVYPNPDQFDPERWLNSDGKIRDDIKFPSFGFGRRICPGRHVANRSVFINAALLLWSFKITQDPENPIDEMAFADGVVAHPKPFAARFQPRFGDEGSLRSVMAMHGEGL
ncbi:cytochrome P450 [Suillus clintonianus]|uniref:cytochrome P450 n=1 Tax=Suillus clintonianus TaxID=1904413 RepID=UPI001B8652A0|nr:cytochrome P450 [Suillus clintonianus]KAG2150821.1 cytochrome P450 [Suillus clintonianus]